MPKDKDGSKRYLDGIIIEKLENIKKQNDEIKKEFSGFKRDIYKKVNNNTTEIARQRGWMAGVAIAGGFLGGIFKGLIFKQ